MRVKENECKEKRIYAWCASKEKNTDAACEVAREIRIRRRIPPHPTTAFSQRRKT